MQRRDISSTPVWPYIALVTSLFLVSVWAPRIWRWSTPRVTPTTFPAAGTPSMNGMPGGLEEAIPAWPVQNTMSPRSSSDKQHGTQPRRQRRPRHHHLATGS